jgi:hypothetical protein
VRGIGEAGQRWAEAGVVPMASAPAAADATSARRESCIVGRLSRRMASPSEVRQKAAMTGANGLSATISLDLVNDQRTAIADG